MKRILLLTTGGTIASGMSEGALRPMLGSEALLRSAPELREGRQVDTLDLMSLDSSNIQPEEWQSIARAVYRALPDYDGVVITHGTDTMAYTASMLSFMLQGLRKPVVLTGSQMPVDQPLSDARGNLNAAFAAADAGLPGVSLAFDHRLLCGCRAVKVRTKGFDAFESVNAPLLGEVTADGLRLAPDWRNGLFAEAETQTALYDRLSTEVFLIKLIPGTDPDLFFKLAELGCRGLVLETFGAGGLHFIRRDLLPRLRELTEAGISVAACSQCLYETSDFSVYETGQRLLDCGVIPGRDMTTEALVTKLMWAPGQTRDAQQVRAVFDRNLAGEVSLP